MITELFDILISHNFVNFTLAGAISYYFLSIFMLTGQPGVEYYGEAHLSKWNSFMHTIGMPFTIHGMLLWIPSLLKLKPSKAEALQRNLYYLYGGYYVMINRYIALLYYILYYIVVEQSIIKYSNLYSRIGYRNDDVYFDIFKRGILISVGALAFQEVIGHYIGGDIASRIEAIPNAIIHAKYFALYHIFN